MSYTALYRKFRPATFAEVKGQDHIVTTLRNQLAADRVGHAYLFCGTRGTGKTSVAKIMARAVNCENPTADGPCNSCATCRAILEGSSTNVIEIDAASNNGVDSIREIREEVNYRPTQGKYKVYIVDEAHMLSTGAFNALLKTLEEPPEYVIFILATTEAGKLPVTILSRCQRYDFHRVSADEIAMRIEELLQAEGIPAEEKAVRYIARAADGSLRDALSLLERCVSFQSEGTLSYERVLELLGTADSTELGKLYREVSSGDAAAAIRSLEDFVRRGKEMGQFVSDFTWYLRDLLLVKSADAGEEILDVSAETYERLKEESALAEEETLMRYIRILSELSGTLRQSGQGRVAVEATLIRLCRPAMDKDNEALLDRVRQLERQLEEGLPVREVIVQQPGAQAPYAAGQPGPQPGMPGAEQPAPPPAKAAPADLLKVKEQWRGIVRDATIGPKGFLEKAVPKYDGETGDNILYIEVEDPFHRKMLNRTEVLEDLENVILGRIGKEVAVRVAEGGEGNSRLAEIPLEKIIGDAASIPIEEYTEPEDDYDADYALEEDDASEDGDTED